MTHVVLRFSMQMIKIVFAMKTFYRCFWRLSQELTKKRWFNKNKLSVNLCKTKIMIFGNSRTNMDVNVIFNHIKTKKGERTYQITFLGVMLDHKII